MYLLCNQTYRPEVDMNAVQVQQSASDPIPTCSFTLEDTGSVISIAEFQEVVVLDEQRIANPATNLLFNPTLNPIATNWTSFAGTGWTISQHGGGGVTFTANNSPLANAFLQQTTIKAVAVPGQNYMLSASFTGATPVGCQGTLAITYKDAAGNTISSTPGSQFTVPNGSTQIFTNQGISPAGTAFILVSIGAIATVNLANSGTITITNVQLEPTWFSSAGQVYPSPFCASGQTNCVVLPNGLAIRQSRVFTGFTNLIDFHDFAGQNRQIDVQAVGPAWLMELTVLSTIYVTKTDSFMINDFVSRFFTGIFTTNHVQTGITFSSFAPNDDSIRALMDAIATSSTFRWYVDPYYDIWYLPVGFYSTLFGLSDSPDNTTTYSYSKYKRTLDFTQPCNRAHVLVSGGPNVVRVSDGASYGNYNQTYFDRKIDDSSVITTNSDAYSRGLAEVVAYGAARTILAVQTDQRAAQPLTPGNSIVLTNSVDAIGPASFLIQKVTITCMGADKTGMVRFLYDAELGAYNANLTNYLVRTARASNQNSGSASLSLVQENIVVVERISIQETQSHTP